MATVNKTIEYVKGFAFVFLLIGVLAWIVVGLLHLCPSILSYSVFIGGAAGAVGSLVGFIRNERFGLGFLESAVANNALWFLFSLVVTLCGLHLLGVICLWGQCQ